MFTTVKVTDSVIKCQNEKQNKDNADINIYVFEGTHMKGKLELSTNLGTDTTSQIHIGLCTSTILEIIFSKM